MKYDEVWLTPMYTGRNAPPAIVQYGVDNASKKRTPDHNNALLMKTSPIDAADNHRRDICH